MVIITEKVELTPALNITISDNRAINYNYNLNSECIVLRFQRLFRYIGGHLGRDMKEPEPRRIHMDPGIIPIWFFNVLCVKSSISV